MTPGFNNIASLCAGPHEMSKAVGKKIPMCGAQRIALYLLHKHLSVYVLTFVTANLTYHRYISEIEDFRNVKFF